jgi:hypothetical protein
MPYSDDESDGCSTKILQSFTPKNKNVLKKITHKNNETLFYPSSCGGGTKNLFHKLLVQREDLIIERTALQKSHRNDLLKST